MSANHWRYVITSNNMRIPTHEHSLIRIHLSGLTQDGPLYSQGFLVICDAAPPEAARGIDVGIECGLHSPHRRA
jgi:hypothetical protein